MKKHFYLFLLLLTSTLLFSCGAKKVEPQTSIEQNSLISITGMQVVSNASNLTGSWSGYIQSDFTTIKISSDGSVEISSNGQTLNEKLVTNNEVDFFITDTKNQQLLQIDLNDSNLVLFDTDGIDYTFSKI